MSYQRKTSKYCNMGRYDHGGSFGQTEVEPGETFERGRPHPSQESHCRLVRIHVALRAYRLSKVQQYCAHVRGIS
jgi:hypothetical protein